MENTNHQRNYEMGMPPTDADEPKPKSGKSKRFLKGLFFLLVIGIISALGYLYYDSSSQLSSLEEKQAKLEDSLNKKNAELAQLKEGDSSSESAGTCEGGASYEAEVGGFVATLDEPYVLVRNLDAGFEGGPATILEVASCIEGEANVFDKPPQREVTITANPNISVDDMKAARASNYGDPLSTEEMTVADVNAERLEYTGLFDSSVIYFEHNDTSFQIELSSSSSDEGNDIITDLTEDWEFAGSEE